MDKYITTETMQTGLLTALVLSLLLALGGWTVVAWQILRGPLAYLVPPGGPGLVRPGVLDDGTALDLAERVLKARFTFTPASYKAEQEAVKRCLGGGAAAALTATMEQEHKLVKQYEVLSQLHVEHAEIRARKHGKVLVHLEGVRTLTIKALTYREESIHSDMVLTPFFGTGECRSILIEQWLTTPDLKTD